MRKILHCLLFVMATFFVTLPAQAGMVGTAQMQAGSASINLLDVPGQRQWIEQQLVIGGVPQADAQSRVASMTDAQVASIHQRIEQEPAGGNTLVIILLILVITELMGWTDIVPSFP